MHLELRHTTRYTYTEPPPQALQKLRLMPLEDPLQQVHRWSVDVKGGVVQLQYMDHHGNKTMLVALNEGQQFIDITVDAELQTADRSGLMGAHFGPMPIWGYLRRTLLTQPGSYLSPLLEDLPSDGQISVPQLHSLAARVAAAVEYVPGQTSATTTAEQALLGGVGVCQDHAQIFISAARELGVPARYVSGYLLLDDTVEQAASHAWAEAHLPDLGWVAFDVSNGISPDERYVRVAVGLDYRDAAPISGLRMGGGNEALDVSVSVARLSGQSQQ